MKDLVLRCLACNAGIVSSYPLETLKVSQQTNKVVIAPKKWSGLDSESDIDTPLDEWIRIEN